MRNFKKIVHWLLLAVILLYLASGLGITQYQIVQKITFGILDKALSFKIHSNLLYAFLVLLFLHLYFVWKRR